jgi:hypothetical protein
VAALTEQRPPAAAPCRVPPSASGPSRLARRASPAATPRLTGQPKPTTADAAAARLSQTPSRAGPCRSVPLRADRFARALRRRRRTANRPVRRARPVLLRPPARRKRTAPSPRRAPPHPRGGRGDGTGEGRAQMGVRGPVCGESEETARAGSGGRQETGRHPDGGGERREAGGGRAGAQLLSSLSSCSSWRRSRRG